MKVYLSVFVTLFFFTLFGQSDQSSFYFSLENLNFDQKFEGFKKTEKGNYIISEEKRRHLVVDKDSIGVRSGYEIILSKSKAIEKGFSFKDGKMYGMQPYNGIHYKEFNDTIFALYFQYDQYFSISREDKIVKGNDGYFIFTPETNGFFSCEYLTFDDEKIIISSIDHSTVMSKLLKLSNIYSKEIDGANTYVAQPSLKELEQLVKRECFNDSRTYLKTEHL